MSKHSRRVFLARITAGGAALGVLQAVGCGGGDSVSCDTNITPDARRTRTALRYVDVTSDASKRCISCTLYTGDATACGTCSAVPGPIHPDGTCSAFVAIPA